MDVPSFTQLFSQPFVHLFKKSIVRKFSNFFHAHFWFSGVSSPFFRQIFNGNFHGNIIAEKNCCPTLYSTIQLCCQNQACQAIQTWVFLHNAFCCARWWRWWNQSKKFDFIIKVCTDIHTCWYIYVCLQYKLVFRVSLNFFLNLIFFLHSLDFWQREYLFIFLLAMLW